jgi:hypothetical protein
MYIEELTMLTPVSGSLVLKISNICQKAPAQKIKIIIIKLHYIIIKIKAS